MFQQTKNLNRIVWSIHSLAFHDSFLVRIAPDATLQLFECGRLAIGIHLPHDIADHRLDDVLLIHRRRRSLTAHNKWRTLVSPPVHYRL